MGDQTPKKKELDQVFVAGEGGGLIEAGNLVMERAIECFRDGKPEAETLRAIAAMLIERGKDRRQWANAKKSSPMENGESPIALERYLIPWNGKEHPLLAQLPEELQAHVRKEFDERVPIGIGRHPTKGLFVLVTQGQGPCLDWAEWRDK